MPTKKKNAPAGKVWRKGYTTKSGKRVTGGYVKKAKKSNRGKPRKRNPSTPRAKPKTRTRTKTVVKYRTRNPKPKVVYRYRNPPKKRTTRRRRRNPNGGTAYAGPPTLKKAMRQVSMKEAIAGGFGLLAASLGPYALSRQFGWDLSSGHRDWLASLGITLGGGLLAGKFAGAAAGKAFAIAGIAVTALKILRTFASGALPSPLFGGQGALAGGGYGALPAPRGIGVSVDAALANASYTGFGGNPGMGQGYYPTRGGGNFYSVGEIHTHV